MLEGSDVLWEGQAPNYQMNLLVLPKSGLFMLFDASAV